MLFEKKGPDSFVKNHISLTLFDWLCIGCLSLTIFLITYFVILVNPLPSQAFAEHNSARFSEPKPEETRVILLGDSRMRYATYSESEISSILEKRLNRPVNVLRIVNNWAVFDDFSPLIRDMIEFSPDLVVLQKELYTKARSPYAVKVFARKYWLWKIFGNGLWDPGSLDQNALQNEMSCSVLNKRETVEGRKKRAYKWFNFSASGRSQESLKHLFKQANDKDIPYVFLSIPITSHAKAGLPSADTKAMPPVIAPNFIIDDQNFCDLVHMNPKGREQYSTWLVDTLVNLLNS